MTPSARIKVIPCSLDAAVAPIFFSCVWLFVMVQRLTLNNTNMPKAANSISHAEDACPFGIIISAASNGPTAEPLLPPT